MRVKIQTCWTGHNFCFRALICGGLRIRSESGNWNRAAASAMLDLIVAETGWNRANIRFDHI